MTSASPVFVATVGGKAQVVTFAYDALRQQGVQPAEVLLFHHAPPDPSHRLHRALRHVRHAFADLPLHLVALRDPHGVALHDLDSPADVEHAWRTIHESIGTLKAQARPVHLCVTGGRRLMAFLALSVAALHFTHSDRVWHLYTPDALRTRAGEGAILHAPPDGPQPYLLDVPIMPGSEAFPALRHLLAASPAEVRAARNTFLEEADRQRCAHVWAALTPRQREVLSMLARGTDPQTVAEHLVITLATVSSHQNAIYAACRIAWALPEEAALDYHWLRERFGRWEGVGDFGGSI